MQYCGATSPSDGLQDKLFVPRMQSAQVDHFAIDSVGRGKLRRVQCNLDHAAVSDERQVGTRPSHMGLSQRYAIQIRRNVFAEFVQTLELEEQDRIFVFQR